MSQPPEQQSYLRAVGTSVRMHLIEQEKSWVPTGRTDKWCAQLSVRKASIEHLRRREQDMRGVSLDLFPRESQLGRPRLPRAMRALEALDSIVEILFTPNKILSAPVRAANISAGIAGLHPAPTALLAVRILDHISRRPLCRTKQCADSEHRAPGGCYQLDLRQCFGKLILEQFVARI
jgi:hypothetical protein